MKKLILVLILVASIAAVACSSAKSTNDGAGTGTENVTPDTTPTTPAPTTSYVPVMGEAWTGSAEQSDYIQRHQYGFVETPYHGVVIWTGSAEQEAFIQLLVSRADYENQEKSHDYFVWENYRYVSLTVEQEAFIQALMVRYGWSHDAAVDQAFHYNAWSMEYVEWVETHGYLQISYSWCDTKNLSGTHCDCTKW